MKPSYFEFDEIQIFDDEKSNLAIIKEIVETRGEENAFHMVDIGDVIKKYKEWTEKIPRVEPHFALKCNPDRTVCKTLAALNCGFDCASKQEMQQILELGVPSERIVYANPAKPHSHIKFAKKVGVDRLTVDSKSELLKIKDLFPEARVVIRFRCDAKISDAQLGLKFGCDPIVEAPELIRMTKDLGLKLHGLSFHVGSQCEEVYAYSRGIGLCKNLLEYAKSVGCKDVRMIDIGGGFPGETGRELDGFAKTINKALEGIDPSIRVLSEPGRYFVASAFTLACFVHSKRTVVEKEENRHMYYVNDGVYGSFLDELMNQKSRQPISLSKPTSDEVYPTTIWGPTCDSFDCIVKDALLPEFQVGDWLIWSDMGAYTLSLASTFNGYTPPVAYPIIRKSAWNSWRGMKGARKNGTPEENTTPEIEDFHVY